MTPVHGIDVSRYQGIVDWAAVKASGLVDFAFVKLGGGDAGVYTDSKAQYNLQQARGNGVPFGVYWYFHGASTVFTQLERIKLLRPWFKDAALPFVIDLEADRPAQEIIDGLALATALDLLGLSVMAYTGAWWWNPRWQQLAVKPALGKVRLWQAAYQISEPAPCLGWNAWTVWQKSSTGTVPGITGNVDLNEARTRFWEPVGERRKVTADALNIRPGPIAAGTPMGVLVKGQEVEVEETVNGWHRLLVGEKLTVEASAGGAAFAPTIGAPPRWLPAVAYISAAYTTPVGEAPPVDPPPPTTPARTFPAWGMNYPNGNLHLVEPAWQGGARAFLIIDDFMFATQLSQREGAFVVARRGDPQPYLTGDLSGDVARMVQWLEGAAGGPRMHYVGLNEGDRYGFSVAEIVYRAKFDVAMAHRVREISGATWVALSAAMGNPEYNNPEIVRVMRRGYAEAYNAGLLMMDCHNYERNPEDIDKSLDERKWYSMRHLFLFGQGPDRCGFDPRVKGIVHCESGLDGGGGGRNPGGFSQFGMTGPQVVTFHRSAYRNAGAPILVDGQWYESPVVAGMDFQCGSDQWEGFEMRQYLADMAGNWTPV